VRAGAPEVDHRSDRRTKKLRARLPIFRHVDRARWRDRRRLRACSRAAVVGGRRGEGAFCNGQAIRVSKLLDHTPSSARRRAGFERFGLGKPFLTWCERFVRTRGFGLLLVTPSRRRGGGRDRESNAEGCRTGTWRRAVIVEEAATIHEPARRAAPTSAVAYRPTLLAARGGVSRFCLTVQRDLDIRAADLSRYPAEFGRGETLGRFAGDFFFVSSISLISHSRHNCIPGCRASATTGADCGWWFTQRALNLHGISDL